MVVVAVVSSKRQRSLVLDFPIAREAHMGFIRMNENGAASEVVYLLSFFFSININLLHLPIISIVVVIIPALELNVALERIARVSSYSLQWRVYARVCVCVSTMFY